MTTPPPLPGAPPVSNRRILPAILLAGTVGPLALHRFYVARYLSGAIQLGIFAIGCFLGRGAMTGIHTIENMSQDQLQDMILNGTGTDIVQISPVAFILVSIAVLWVVVDCVQLAAGKFKDAQGAKLTRWI